MNILLLVHVCYPCQQDKNKSYVFIWLRFLEGIVTKTKDKVCGF